MDVKQGLNKKANVVALFPELLEVHTGESFQLGTHVRFNHCVQLMFNDTQVCVGMCFEIGV